MFVGFGIWVRDLCSTEPKANRGRQRGRGLGRAWGRGEAQKGTEGFEEFLPISRSHTGRALIFNISNSNHRFSSKP